MGRGLASCACLLMLLSGCTRPTPQQQTHSKAALVIEQTAVTPGSKVNVGIQIVTDSGWHIYWQNPGDSGEPPQMQWQLPSGVTTGELGWPTPIRLTTTAGTDFGYEGTTVLLSALQIPTTMQSGTITVGGDLRWLVCHDICVSQSTHLEAPIRIASVTSINDSAHQLLQSAAERLPKPLPASYRPEVASLRNSFRLTFISNQPITQSEFFPGDEAEIDNGAPQEVVNHAGIVSLTLKKSDYLQQEPQHLQGVLVLNGRDAYLLDAPIHRSATQKGSPPK
jgi:DsbC/DsbD-like thiol-disulfide interchange protein